MSVSGNTISLATAQRLLDSAQEMAERLGSPMALAVVDAGGSPIALRRMDGASLIATATVAAKARTAVFFGRPTADILESARRNPIVYGSFPGAIDESVVYSMGGLPLVTGDLIVGAVAASGGTGEEDVAVAEAAARAFQEAR